MPDTVGTVAKLLLALVEHWNDAKKTEIRDRVIELDKDWYDESNKPWGARDNARMDDIELELRILANTVLSGLGKPNAGAGPG